MTRNLMRATLSAFVLVTLAACGSAAGSAEEEELTPQAQPAAAANTATITVDNNQSDARNISVVLRPEAGGVAVTLGAVDANRMGTFTQSVQTGYYRLVARVPAGEDRTSQRFHLANGRVATWNMDLNRVTVISR